MHRFFAALFMALAFCAQVHAADHYCPEFLAQKDAPEPSHRGEFTFSPYTIHWSNNPAHKHVVLVALDEQLPGGRLCGVSFFSNSFGQPSTYIYAGQQFNQLFGQPDLFLKVTAGIMYGYVGAYQHKVPFNYRGFSPAVIPSLGYKFTEHDSVQVKLLGTAGVMFSYGRQF
ncbi:MAG: hypothetical protein ACKOWC_03380 [Limnohabitans sp.]